MTRRDLGKLVTGFVATLGIRPVKVAAKTVEPEYYDITFGIGISDPVEKGIAVCPNYTVYRPGKIVAVQILPGEHFYSGDLSVAITHNGKGIDFWSMPDGFAESTHKGGPVVIRVGDKLNLDVVKASGIWRDVRAVLRVKV